MEEDVEPKDEDGVDGRGVSGWDGWVGGLGAVGASSIVGLVRRVGTFTTVFPTFVLVSRMLLAPQYRVNDHFLSATSCSQRETMVGDSLCMSAWVSVGCPSSLGRTFDQHIRVMGGWVIWVRWVSHR
jgi:hypothetical protein